MSSLRVIIPVFIVLGLLQAAVLTLPFAYWRFAAYMGPVNKILFGSFLLFLAFVAHPLLIITLITFTIAPALLSIRHSLTSSLSNAYTALVPLSARKEIMSSIPVLNDIKVPKSNRDWLLTLISSYVGWKILGTLPSLMILLVFISLWKGKEADGDRGWLAKGLRDGNKDMKAKGNGVATRSERTDVQVVEQ